MEEKELEGREESRKGKRQKGRRGANKGKEKSEENIKGGRRVVGEDGK